MNREGRPYNGRIPVCGSLVGEVPKNQGRSRPQPLYFQQREPYVLSPIRHTPPRDHEAELTHQDCDYFVASDRLCDHVDGVTW